LISNSGIPTCSAPAGSALPTGPFQTLQSNASNVSVWNTNVGIGQAPGTDPLDITDNVNAAAAVTFLNNSSGTAAQTFYQVSNGTDTASFGIMGTAATVNPNIPPNTAYLNTPNAAGLQIVVGVPSASITLWSGASVKSYVNGNLIAQVRPLGMDIGSSTVGTDPLDITYNNNGNAVAQITNTNAGLNAISGLVLKNGTYVAGVQLNGTGNTSNPAFAANSLVISNNGNGGMDFVDYLSQPIQFWVGSQYWFTIDGGGIHSANTVFANAVSASGGGYGSISTTNNVVTVANGATAILVATCSGQVNVADTTQTGDDGMYVCGGTVCHFLGSSTGTIWVASTSAPAAGHASVYGSGQGIAVANNQGAPVSYGVTSICNRAGE